MRRRLAAALEQGATVDAGLDAKICYRSGIRIGGRFGLVSVESWRLGSELKLRFSVVLNEEGSPFDMVHTVELAKCPADDEGVRCLAGNLVQSLVLRSTSGVVGGDGDAGDCLPRAHVLQLALTQ